MNIKTLETFVWIARLGSFRAAARRLYASQPSVSARISTLEDELRTDLFDRTGRKAVLTAKGRQLLVFAEKILQLHSELLETVARPDAIHGTIRLGVSETIAYTWLPRLIEKISDAYPAVDLELDVDISLNLADKLVSREIDIAFLIGEVSQPDIINQPFCRYSLVWVASPLIALPDEPIRLSDLARIPIITYPRRSEPYANIRSLIHPMNHPTQIHSSSSLSTIIRMTVDGLGVSALPREILTREIESGALREFRVEASLPDLIFNIAYSAAPGGTVLRAVAELSLDTVGGDCRESDQNV